MREYLDPVYFQHPFQTGSSSSERYQPGKSSSSSVKKSNSVLNGGSVSSSVLGKFLKIAKSKSDVQGRPKSRASTYNGYDVEEDFRLSPSVLHRGPVEKMVHKSNSRKDVSRSHSWIYGSVKLPSDLPFGYGYSIGGGNHSHSPSGSDNSNSGGSRSPTGSHHTHGMTALSIPRCQMVDYYNPSCDCNFTGDFDFITAGPNESNPNANNGPCKACICEWTVSPPKNSKGRNKSANKSGSSESGNTFVNSVRKLTWKSLKQAVKKRPSLDNLKRGNELRSGGGCVTPTPFIPTSSGHPDVFSNPNGIHPVVLGSHGDLLEGNPPFYHNSSSPQHAFSADDLQPSYFFPEKKNMYASCTDIYREPPPHVTASVRVRPKPSRQSWDFPTEFGPVPNYQEDELYHSEWDLRQCIPYDVWVSTTSHVKPRATMSSSTNGRSKTPEASSSSSVKNASLSKSTSVPYLAASAASSSKSQSSMKALSSNGLSSKSSSSGLINGVNSSSSNNSSNRASDTLSVKSIESSSKSSSNGKGSYRSPSAASNSNGVVKRPSILSSDVNAYQLLKAQTRNAKNSSTTSSTTTRRTATNKTARTNGSIAVNKDGDLSDALSSSSDDLSDNVLTSESHMRIAGQKIYMAPNLNGNQSGTNNASSSSLSSRNSYSSSNSSGSTKSSGFVDPKIAKAKGTSSVEIDEWSEDEDMSRMKQHVSMVRDRVPNKANKTSMMSRGEHIQNAKHSKSVRSTQNGTQFGLNNNNYNNCRENNGTSQSGGGFNSGDNSVSVSNGHLSANSRVGQQANPTTSSFHNAIGSNQTHINQHTLQRESDSLNDNETVEFEEYEFEEHPPSSRTVNFHNQNKSTISKPTHELSSSSSAEDSRSCGNDLATNVEKSTTPIMRNPMANQHQAQRTQSYVKKGQQHGNANIITTTPGGNIKSYTLNGSSSSTFTSGVGNSTSHNGSTHNKLNGLRRRKSRNGSNNPGKLLREVIYEEDVEHENNSMNEPVISHDADFTARSEMGGSSFLHDSSQSSNKSNEYAVKIVVSHTGGTSGSEYVKPILKNRERVYDTPSNTGGPNYGSPSPHERSVGFSNTNDIYYDSSVSTTSKKKVQFDQNKVIVCGGDSGPDSDEYSMNEDDAAQEKLISRDNRNDSGNEEHETKIGTTTMKTTSTTPPDCWGSTGNNNESTRNYNHHYESNEESGSVSLKSNLSRKLASPRSNDDNLGPNQSEELKQKPKSLFEEEVARKAASFALSRSKKAAEEVEAEKAIKNVASSREECYDRSVNNLQQVRLNNETEMRLTSSANSRTNMTTFAAARSNLKSINSPPNATTTAALGSSSSTKPSVSRNSQGTGSLVNNPQPTQQPPCGKQNPSVELKSPLANKADTSKAFSHKPTPNKTSHGVTSNAMKSQRTPGITDSPKIRVLNEGPTEQQKIINPNSLLFNDTTRIRLNQSRPSLNETFKLNLTQNGQGSRHGSAHQAGPVARSIRIKQSNSFRSIGSAPLRPREPPPPPPTSLQKLGVKLNTRLQKSISTSALAVHSERELKKSLSTNQLSNGHGSHYGNRLLTKSEISLPIALQSTSNQASLKNENIYGQKDNNPVNINGPNSNKSPSGSETNNSKTPLGARTNLNRSKTSTTTNNINTSSLSSSSSVNGSRSKSLTDRCEALDKVLGQQHKAKANANNQQGNNKSCGGSHAQLRNNANRNNVQKEVMIEGKVQKHQTPQSGETLRNSGGQPATMTSSHISQQPHVIPSKSPSQLSQSITALQQTSPTSTMDAQQSAQNIEIVTRENSVSEIRIYSTGNNNNEKAKEIYGSTKTIISSGGSGNNGMKKCDNSSSVQEIHYAATDLFPQNEFLNGKNQFRKPAPLPLIPSPHESIVSQTRPQSTSVVLIIDNNNGRSETQDSSSPPITYSQPIDTLTHVAPFKQLPPPPASPKGITNNRTSPSDTLTSQEIELGFCNNNNDCNLETEEGDDDDDLCEPLYDDVINHTLAADLTTKGTGSIGKSSIISSISSRKSNGSRKSILDSAINRPSQLPPEPPMNKGGQVLSSTLPCMACPPSLPPPNLPTKNLSEFHNRPIILNEDEGSRSNSFNDANCELTLDEEVDNLYNDISDGGVSLSNNATGKSLQSFASSMKGALLSAIKSMDFDRRSIISSTSNNSNGSTKKDDGMGKASRDSICEGEDVIYDDTLSIRSSNCGAADTSRTYYHATFNAVKPQAEIQSPSKYQSIITKPLANLIEQDEPLSDEADSEPLYDDVINLPTIQNRGLKSKDGVNSSSDSGAESEDATPPPLPAQGPPIHLRSKIASELPVIPFPLVASRSTEQLDGNRAFDDSGSEMSREGSMEKVIGIVDYSTNNGMSSSLTSSASAIQNSRKGEDALITKTRSLLNELNEKLSQLNIISPDASSSSGSRGLLNVDFSSLSPNKATVSSSSESSGVEEDYNSEKNYSLSNTSDAASGSSAEENYKLAQVSKLVTETITMARGKFLNSMKSNNNSNGNPLLILSTSRSANNGETAESPTITEEPIYEEIGDMNRPTSPIYSDAFDAKSIFDGASRNEILSFLESIRDRLTTTSDSNSSGSQSSSISSKKGHESNSRNDSGIGPDALLALNNALLNVSEKTVVADKEESKLVLRKLCPDCNDVPVDNEESTSTQPDSSIILQNGIILCLSCNRKRNERKEIIMEIHETEMKYGRDLQIISEEFYKPIQIAGLLSKDQLDMIFLNVVELMEISAQLTTMLKKDIESACGQRNDEDLTGVNVGKIFLEIGESMMTAFQTYCTRQASAGALLAQLEKEKELLRIFLRVSQMENTVLRRMNLPAFLMVPVQRVTRYPLLLSRLLKVTPVDHFTREELQCAHEKIELHLEHMNKSTREVASVKLWRRISIINGNSTPLPRRATNDLEGASVSIRKMAVDVLDWASLQDVTCVMDNQLSVLHFNGKPLRGIYGCLLVRGKDLETIIGKMDDDMFFPPAEDIVKEVKLVLVRVKNTRFCLLREPLCLSNCVISQGENEFQDFVEINEISSKNTYHLQGIDKQATANWLKYMQCYSMCVGQWRKRRIGLANIMMLRHL